MDSLKKEVKILKYQRGRDEMNRAMESFKASNSKLFENGDTLEKLEKELEYVSDALPAKERIERASKIAFGNIVSSTDSAYLSMQDVSMGSQSVKTVKDNTNKANPEMDNLFNNVIKSRKDKESYLKKFS